MNRQEKSPDLWGKAGFLGRLFGEKSFKKSEKNPGFDVGAGAKGAVETL